MRFSEIPTFSWQEISRKRLSAEGRLLLPESQVCDGFQKDFKRDLYFSKKKLSTKWIRFGESAGWWNSLVQMGFEKNLQRFLENCLKVTEEGKFIAIRKSSIVPTAVVGVWRKPNRTSTSTGILSWSFCETSYFRQSLTEGNRQWESSAHAKITRRDGIGSGVLEILSNLDKPQRNRVCKISSSLRLLQS